MACADNTTGVTAPTGAGTQGLQPRNMED